MILRCPVCKADNSRGPECRRCTADLSMLFTLEEQRAALLMKVRQAFDSGNIDEALRCAQAADELRHGLDVTRWLTILNLLGGRCRETWQAYQSIHQHA